MKKLLFLFSLLPNLLLAQTNVYYISWTNNDNAITGYKIYWGTNSNPSKTFINFTNNPPVYFTNWNVNDLSLTNYPIYTSNLFVGANYFAVQFTSTNDTPTNIVIDSDLSNPVTFYVPSSPNLHSPTVNITSYLETSADFSTWTKKEVNLGVYSVAVQNSQKFFRSFLEIQPQ